LGALTTFTDAIAAFVTGVVIFIVGGWIAWQAYKAIQEYDRQEFEGMIRHIIGAVMAAVALFSADFILNQITT
jgi:divalent metal cation (Fe/Co/Zn/Cd) transporter